jgi:hypothetical protein
LMVLENIGHIIYFQSKKIILIILIFIIFINKI